MALSGMQTRQIAVLWNAGRSMAQIAESMGVSLWQIAPVLPGVSDVMLGAVCHVADVERRVGKHPRGTDPRTDKACPWMMVLDGALTVGSVKAYQ